MLKKLFGKKDKGVEDNGVGVQETVADTSVTKKKKKKQEMMSSVLNESVLESVLDDFRSNKRFVATDENGPVYIGLWLDVENIGGLSKKQSRDEAKGSIVELINGSHIKTLLTPDLLERECIIFYPDAMTLDRMGEFSLLVDAPYTVAYVFDDGTYEDSGVETSYELFVRYLESDASIEDFLSGHDIVLSNVEEPEVNDSQNEQEPFYESFMRPTDEDEDEYELAEDSDTPFGEDDEEVVESNYYEEESSFTQEEDIFEGVESAEFDPDYLEGSDYDEMSENSLDDYSSEYTEDDVYEEEEAEEIIVDEGLFNQTIKRVFYSEDLGLEVSTEPFDAQFLQSDNLVLFAEERGEGWLNDYLSMMSQDANTEIKRLHEKNLSDMRRSYQKLISAYCEKIQDELDFNDEDTLSGSIMHKLRLHQKEQEDGIYNKAAQRRADINKAWSEKLEQVGEDAKVIAQQQYRERFGRQHDEELNRIEPILRQQIEADYQKSLRDLHENRREEAAKMLDLGITEVLNDLFEEYKVHLAEEQVVYQQHRDSLMDFINENRRNDVAHDKILAMELAQSEKADGVMREYREKLDVQTAEFNAKRATLELEVEEIRRRSEAEAKRQEDLYNNQLARIREELEDARNDNKRLMNEYANLDEKKSKEYEGRLLLKDEEKAQLISNFEKSETTVKRQNGLFIAVAVVGIIASLFVGIVFGMKSNQGMSQSEINTQVEQRVQEYIKTQEQGN